MKEQNFDILIEKMSHCNKCIKLKNKNGKDCSLNNFYKEKMAKKIPSIWTDWYNRLNSKIMIIGQDWGPYLDMKEFYEKYEKNKTRENYIKIIDEEKSLTKKMLEKYLTESRGKEVDLGDFFITNAIMCARKGNYYRSDNVKLKESTLNCMNYLKEQIDIVKPKIILTLGFYPLLSLANIFNFSIEDTLSKTIDKIDIIKVSNYIIIPLYHPTAQIVKEKQLKQYRKIWKYI